MMAAYSATIIEYSQEQNKLVVEDFWLAITAIKGPCEQTYKDI